METKLLQASYANMLWQELQGYKAAPSGRLLYGRLVTEAISILDMKVVVKM